MNVEYVTIIDRPKNDYKKLHDFYLFILTDHVVNRAVVIEQISKVAQGIQHRIDAGIIVDVAMVAEMKNEAMIELLDLRIVYGRLIFVGANIEMRTLVDLADLKLMFEFCADQEAVMRMVRPH
jgi:hypothetical protein